MRKTLMLAQQVRDAEYRGEAPAARDPEYAIAPGKNVTDAQALRRARAAGTIGAPGAQAMMMGAPINRPLGHSCS